MTLLYTLDLRRNEPPTSRKVTEFKQQLTLAIQREIFIYYKKPPSLNDIFIGKSMENKGSLTEPYSEMVGLLFLHNQQPESVA